MRPVIVIALLAACSERPASTGTVCDEPDPYTLAYTKTATPACAGSEEDCNFGKQFMDTYCIQCHLSGLGRSKRHGAPLYHDYDSLLGVRKTPEHIDQQAGIGPAAENHFMPPERCPSVAGGPIDRDCAQPTDDERRKLAQWIACERDRPFAPPP